MWHCWIVWDRLFQKPVCTLYGDDAETFVRMRHAYAGGDFTRAKHQLEFFTSKRCDVTRLEISPFIYELHAPKEEEAKVAGERPVAQPKKLREGGLRRGMRITHATLGEGRIMKISEGMMQVQFQTESKTLNIHHCIMNELIDLV